MGSSSKRTSPNCYLLSSMSTRLDTSCGCGCCNWRMKNNSFLAEAGNMILDSNFRDVRRLRRKEQYVKIRRAIYCSLPDAKVVSTNLIFDFRKATVSRSPFWTYTFLSFNEIGSRHRLNLTESVKLKSLQRRRRLNLPANREKYNINSKLISLNSESFGNS